MDEKQKKVHSISEIMSQIKMKDQPSPRNLILPPIDKEFMKEKMRRNYRKKWRNAGFCNRQFNKSPILKPKLLDNWQIQRINLSKRTYEYPKDYKGMHVRYVGGYFEPPSSLVLNESLTLLDETSKPIEHESSNISLKEKKRIFSDVNSLASLRTPR